MKFSQKMRLYFFYTMVQKSQKLPKTQIKGGGGPALRHFRATIRFLNIRAALDFKSTPLKTVLKNLDFTTEL